MVSLKHEGLAKLVRDRPAFAADLLGGLLAVKVPPFSKAQLVDVTLNQVRPAEYRADAVVLFTRKKPVFGAIVEVQLRPKKQKRFSWPLYAVGARARERCPFVVLAVTSSAATAKWAARPIELGGGNQYRPLVVGATVEVRIGGAEIQVRRGFDGQLLRAVVEALRGGVE
jgi:hypothetical protein